MDANDVLVEAAKIDKNLIELAAERVARRELQARVAELEQNQCGHECEDGETFEDPGHDDA